MHAHHSHSLAPQVWIQVQRVHAQVPVLGVVGCQLSNSTSPCCRLHAPSTAVWTMRSLVATPDDVHEPVMCCVLLCLHVFVASTHSPCVCHVVLYIDIHHESYPYHTHTALHIGTGSIRSGTTSNPTETQSSNSEYPGTQRAPGSNLATLRKVKSGNLTYITI